MAVLLVVLWGPVGTSEGVGLGHRWDQHQEQGAPSRRPRGGLRAGRRARVSGGQLDGGSRGQGEGPGGRRGTRNVRPGKPPSQGAPLPPGPPPHCPAGALRPPSREPEQGEGEDALAFTCCETPGRHQASVSVPRVSPCAQSVREAGELRGWPPSTPGSGVQGSGARPHSGAQALGLLFCLSLPCAHLPRSGSAVGRSQGSKPPLRASVTTWAAGPLRAVRRLCLPSPSRELTGQAGPGSACRPHWAVAHSPGSEPGARAADAPCWRPGVGHAPMAGVSPEAPRLGVRPPSPRVLTRPAVVVLTPSSCKGTSRTSFHLLHLFEGPISTRARPEVLGAGVGTRSGHGCHPAGARAPHPHRLNLLCLASDRCLK